LEASRLCEQRLLLRLAKLGWLLRLELLLLELGILVKLGVSRLEASLERVLETRLLAPLGHRTSQKLKTCWRLFVRMTSNIIILN
jgi:hypothetical protein